MSRFRKKPVVIEAWQFTGIPDTWPHTLPEEWRPDWVYMKTNAYKPDNTLRVNTLEGVMVAQVGDWIIRGIKGEVYPCKPDIFAATYEAVE